MKAERKKRAIVVPDKGERQDRGPLLAWAGHGDHDGRDVTKPLGYDADGNPLYAPRGITFRVPWS
jgi:hypothetical protein